MNSTIESASVGSASQSKATFKLNAPQATDEAIDDNNSYSDMQEQLEKQHSSNNYGNNQTMPTHTQTIPPPGMDESADRGVKAGDDDSSSSSDEPRKLPLKCMIISGGVAIVLLIGLIVIVAVALSNQPGKSNPSPASTSPPIPPGGTAQPGAPPTDPPVDGPTPVPTTHLGRIKLMGTLKCGIPVDQPGFALVNATTGRMEGFDADLCRAVAAGIFGSSQGRVEFKPLTAFERFTQLEAGEVDMLARTTTHTMQRQVMESATGAGFDFSIPYLYNGLQFAGKTPFVHCANNFTTADECAETKICVLDGTTHQNDISSKNSALSIVSTPSSIQLYRNFVDELCNVIAGEQFDIAETIIRAQGYLGDYELGSGIHSKEPLCIVTRDDDQQWSDFVNWIMTALLAAEDVGVSQRTAIALGRTEYFGPDFRDMFINAVKDVGNYGEVYRRHLEPILPRPEPDRINNGETGLIYSFPFGSVTPIGFGAVRGGTLEKILMRGRLRCGISRRSIFAEFDQITQSWSGFDVDFCRAVAAAIFDGELENKVEFADLSNADAFSSLANGDVDVLSRITTANLERDVMERDTGVGFSFTQPTFYDGMTFAGRPPFASCAGALDVTSSSCQGVKICVTQGTNYETRLRDLFPERFIVPQASGELAVVGLVREQCNVLAGGVVDVSRTRVDDAGFQGEYEFVSNRYSKDPLALVTREDDTQFSAFVFWVVSIIFAAEELGITQAEANRMTIVNLFGPGFMGMFRSAIAAVGNYGEIYERNAEKDMPRGGLNLVNQQLGGPQHYPLPGVVPT